jgi:hypothetical protein
VCHKNCLFLEVSSINFFIAENFFFQFSSFFPVVSRFYPTFLKMESEAYEITSLSVCLSPLITFEPIGRFLLNSEIQEGGHAIEDDLDAVLFNPVPSTIPKRRTFKLLRWMQNLHQSTWDHEILYTDRSSKDEQLLIRQFLSKTKNTNMAAV